MMMSTRGASLPSIETRDLTAGKIFVVYRNGDTHFGGKKYVLNPRSVPNFDAFLDDVKKYVPNETAIRRIYTPDGGSRVTDFSQLQSEKRYVCAGKERFKRINYTQIESYSPRRRHRPLRDERVIPAHHNKYLENISGKIHQIPTQGKFIEVFVNGKFDTPTTVGISYRQLENMDDTIKVIHEAITEKHQYRVDELCDVEGHPITRVDQIESGGLYVARKHYHQFQKGRYDPHGKKNIIIPLSPREKPPKYLWKERTLPPIHQQKKHSPDHSVSSYPETRKRNQVNGVPVKPAKHTKRTPKQADYDKDDGGVFKAKGQNRDTRGAREVRDTGDTKVDLPIDQVRAEEVKDERIKKEKQGKDTNSRPTKQADHSHNNRAHGRANEDASKISVNSSQNKTVQNGKNSTYKSNSKAPPPDNNRSKNDVKNDSRKVPSDEERNYNNHDPVRSSTPNDSQGSSPTKTYSDTSEENKAATKIQANYRGHLARQEVNTLKKKKEADIDAEKRRKEDEARAKQTKAENEAATKIQAGFRGHQARKEIRDKKQTS